MAAGIELYRIMIGLKGTAGFAHSLLSFGVILHFLLPLLSISSFSFPSSLPSLFILLFFSPFCCTSSQNFLFIFFFLLSRFLLPFSSLLSSSSALPFLSRLSFLSLLLPLILPYTPSPSPPPPIYHYLSLSPLLSPRSSSLLRTHTHKKIKVNGHSAVLDHILHWNPNR